MIFEVFFGWGKSRLQILAPSKKGQLRNTAEEDEFFNVQYSVLDRFLSRSICTKSLFLNICIFAGLLDLSIAHQF